MNREHGLVLVSAVGAALCAGVAAVIVAVFAPRLAEDMTSIGWLIFAVLLLFVSFVSLIIAFREVLRAYTGATNRKLERQRAEATEAHERVHAALLQQAKKLDDVVHSAAEARKRFSFAERRYLAAIDTHASAHGNGLAKFESSTRSALEDLSARVRSLGAQQRDDSDQVGARVDLLGVNLEELIRGQRSSLDTMDKWAKGIHSQIVTRTKAIEHLNQDQTGLLGQIAHDLTALQLLDSRVRENQSVVTQVSDDVTELLTAVAGASSWNEDAHSDLTKSLQDLETALHMRATAVQGEFAKGTARIAAWADDSESRAEDAEMHLQRLDRAVEQQLVRSKELMSSVATVEQLLLDQSQSVDAESSDMSLSGSVDRDSGLHSVEQALRAHVEAVAINTVRQIEALLQILPLVDTDRRSMPPLGSWAMTPDGMLVVADLIRARRPKLILELGSGSSTAWIAKISARTNSRVISIEHSQAYYSKTKEVLDQLDLTHPPELRLAELKHLTVEDQSYRWYDLAQFEDLRDIDMLIVDGPPKAVGDNSRFPALPMLIDRMSETGCVLLDDAHRPHERGTLKAWLAQFPALEQVESGSTRVAVLTKKKLPTHEAS